MMKRRTPTPKPTPPAIPYVPNLQIWATRLNKATPRKSATAPFIVLTAPQHTFMIAGKRGKKEKILASTNNNNNNNNNNN